MATHRIEIGDQVRELPIREVAPGVSVALFDILGDWALTEAAGVALAKLLPPDIEATLMPDGKAVGLMHVVGRESGLPTYIPRKEKKPYMAEPVVHVELKSMTTDRRQMLFLGADHGEALKGKKVAIVDDVVSTGGTLVAVKALLEQVGAEHAATLAVFTEGDERSDVIALGHLPLF
jgi:adenine phosphoribosyltransferase